MLSHITIRLYFHNFVVVIVIIMIVVVVVVVVTTTTIIGGIKLETRIIGRLSGCLYEVFNERFSLFQNSLSEEQTLLYDDIVSLSLFMK